MRILFQTPYYLPATRYGGPVFSVHGLARALARDGHEVVVLTTNLNGEDVSDVPVAVPVVCEGVEVRYYPVDFPRRLFRSKGLNRALEKEVPRADVLHTNGVFLLPGNHACAVARASGTPYIIAPRGMLAAELVAGKSSLAKALWIQLLERRNILGASALHLTSVLEAEGVREGKLDLAPILTVPNGVFIPEELGTAAEIDEVWDGVDPGRRIAFLGRLDWKKGVDLAVKVMEGLPGMHLFVAGNDQVGMRAKLEREMGRWLKPRVRFLGELSGRRKWSFLKGADLLLVPSINENFGNVVVEALGVGTLVVCTEGVGAAEIVRRLDSSLVVVRTVEALTAAVRGILNDGERRMSLGIRASSLISEEYNWAVISASMARKMAEVTDLAAAPRTWKRGAHGI